MKRIVDIPDKMYDWIDNGFPDEDDYIKLWEKIRQGTPLEEEYEKIKKEFEDRILLNQTVAIQIIDRQIAELKENNKENEDG